MQTADVEPRLWIAAAACFAAFVVLGRYVAPRTPSRIDAEAEALRGEWTPVAVVFTALGRWPALVTVGLVAAVAAFVLHAQPVAIAALAASQALSQSIVSATKHRFHRTRPDYWLVRREADLSYPSGHAATTVVFYLALALLVSRTSSLPRPVMGTLLAGLAWCVAGIPWSRIALGAHYLTDVAGGLLFGAGWLCATLALVLRFAPERLVR
ncbi:MAG: phosphatase PAP2 family protein [Candidatus Velthaea sp.]